MKRSLSLVLLGAALAAAAPAVSAQDALPSGRDVIDRFIEALGGRAAILAQPGRHVYGRFEVPAQGMSGDLEVFAQPPNKTLVKVTLAGIGEIRNGFDGTTAWTLNPMMGPMVLDSLQLRQMEQQADMYSALYPESHIAALETVARETFEGTECYNVQVTTTWGETYNEYFDVATGLQVGSRRKQESPMGAVESVTIMSDYRDLDGLKAPFRQVVRTMGIDQVIVIDSATAGQVPDSVFALPPEIQALIKKP